MKRTLKALGISLACGTVALGGLVYSFPPGPSGCVASPHGVCWASGVYIGHGFMLTNQHVAMSSSEESSFRVPGWKYIWRTIEADIEQTAFLDRDIELGVVKLKPSMLDFVGVATPCLSARPVKRGQTLKVTSSVSGKFPPVPAVLVVSDPRPLMRLNPFPTSGSPYYGNDYHRDSFGGSSGTRRPRLIGWSGIERRRRARWIGMDRPGIRPRL